jgi:hypothetical protein
MEVLVFFEVGTEFLNIIHISFMLQRVNVRKLKSTKMRWPLLAWYSYQV